MLLDIVSIRDFSVLWDIGLSCIFLEASNPKICSAVLIKHGFISVSPIAWGVFTVTIKCEISNGAESTFSDDLYAARFFPSFIFFKLSNFPGVTYINMICP